MKKYFKRDNDDIEEKANNLLNDLLFDMFAENELKLVKHESGRREIGVDFFYQIFNRNTDKQILFFEVQNKGTDKELKVIKTKTHPEFNKISFQLELRHVKQYYYEMAEPLLFVLCDINSQKAYWYPIQIDRTIPDRIIDKEEKSKKKKTKTPSTLQIYISKENEICSENFKEIFNDIEISKEEQIRKHNSNIPYEANYSFLEKEIKGKNIIDQLYITIKKFEGINILPPNVITSLPVLKAQTDRNRVWINNFSLKNDNEKLYDLISNIKLIDNKLSLKSNKNLVENQAEKLLSIINFFKINNIKYIEWGGKGHKKDISIYHLYLFSNCDCERCSFNGLKLNRVKQLLNQNKKNETLLEQLRKGYTAYLIGDLSKSVYIFNKINSEAAKLDNSILYIISKFNLIQLKKIIKWNYFKSDKETLLKKIKFDNLSEDIGYIKKKVPHFLDVYNYIKDETFHKNASQSIDDILDETRNMWFYDKHGSTYHNDKVNKLMSILLKFYSFLEYNFLIFDYFDEHKNFMTKVLESSFALYSISNSKSSKYQKIDSFLIKIWLFYVPFKNAKTLLHKYALNQIKTVSISNELHSYIDNLNDSINVLVIGNSPYYFGDKIERVIKNLTLLLSRIDITNDELNSILSKILMFVNKIGHRKLIPFEGFQQIFEYKNITKDNANSILKIYIEDDNINSYALKVYIEKASNEEIKQLVLKTLKIKDFNTGKIDNKKITKIPYAISLLDKEFKVKIEEEIIMNLKKEFDDELFNISVLFDLIKFDKKMFKKFLLTIPDKSKMKKEQVFFGNDENYKLSSVVNIMYKLKLPFTNDIKKYINYCVDDEKDYFEWLMDLDGFNYSKFDAYWILKYRTKYYIKAFRSSKKLKKEIRKSLKRNYVEGIAMFSINNNIL